MVEQQKSFIDYGVEFKEACVNKEIKKAVDLLRSCPDLVCFRDGVGQSPLHFACQANTFELVQLLLEEGHQWNAVDQEGRTCLDFDNVDKDVYNCVLNEGIRAELVFNLLNEESDCNEEATKEHQIPNKEYLDSRLNYSEDKLLDVAKNGVMMQWEDVLMKSHVKNSNIKKNESVVLNIGFGMGIIDTLIQEEDPRLHVIVEAHKDVYDHMCKTGWDKINNVKIINGRWQDKIKEIGEYQYDYIFFDTFGEYYKDLKQFHDNLLLFLNQDNPNSTYSFFNGLGAQNQLFYDVYCEVCKIHLEEMNIETKYIELKVPDPVHNPKEGGSVWEGVAHKYWQLPVYRLPVCKIK